MWKTWRKKRGGGEKQFLGVFAHLYGRLPSWVLVASEPGVSLIPSGNGGLERATSPSWEGRSSLNVVFCFVCLWPSHVQEWFLVIIPGDGGTIWYGGDQT